MSAKVANGSETLSNVNWFSGLLAWLIPYKLLCYLCGYVAGGGVIGRTGHQDLQRGSRMEDVNDVRLRNYKALMLRFREKESERGEPERGLLNRFGKFVEISPRYLSHVNNGRKAIGAQTARQIETAFGLPLGWMDHDHMAGPAPSSRSEREYLELALRLFRQSPIEAQSLLLKYVSERMLGNQTDGEASAGRAEGGVQKRMRMQAKG